MPTPAISVTINEPRLELKREGWSKSRVASSFRAGVLSKVPGQNDACLDRFLPADMPDDVWQDPDTGYMLLRPSSLRPDFAESSEFHAARIALANLTIPPPVAGVPLFDEPADPETGKPKLIALQRDDPAVDLPALTGVPGWAENVHPASNESSMVFVAAFNGPLSINEGITITVQPSGLATDRASAWFGVMFGDRYYLQLGMNGSAALWEYRYATCNTGTSDDWVRRERFEYSQGGVDHTKPFQITIMPWGMEFISIFFSQATQTSQRARASDRRVSSNTFTFRVTLGVDDLPRFDVAHGHYVKLEPAPIRIAMRKKGYQYAFAIARLRFGSESSMYGLTEQLTEPKSSDVTITPIGFFPTGTDIDASKVNEDGAVWNPIENVRFAPRFTLKSSPDRKYTPEMWGMEYDVPAEPHTPPNVPFDISTAWTSLHWRETCHPDSSELSIVMRRDLDWLNLLKLDGNVTIRVNGEERFQGYIEQYRPHFDGLPVTPLYKIRTDEGLGATANHGVPLRDNPVADDHWQRLADTDAANFRSLTRKNIGDIFYEGLKRAGYDDSEINIAIDVYDLEVGGFERATDWKQPQEDSNVADLFRRLMTTYGAQNAGNLRCFRRSGIWRVYISTAFNGTPDATFMLSDSVFYAAPVSDVARWEHVDGPRLRVTTQPEIYVRRPEFNELRCFSTDEPGENAIALSAYIAAHPRTVNDPTYVRYESRVRPKTMGPSECGHLSTQNEIERFARKTYDEQYRSVIQWTHAGEWHPNIRPDQCAWIVGIGPDGSKISYGVWRIEEIEISIDHDNVPDPAIDGDWTPKTLGNRQFSWQADYTMAWESAYETETIPMWSEVHP